MWNPVWKDLVAAANEANANEANANEVSANEDSANEDSANDAKHAMNDTSAVTK